MSGDVPSSGGVWTTQVRGRDVVFCTNQYGDIIREFGYHILGGEHELTREEGWEIAQLAEAEFNKRKAVQ